MSLNPLRTMASSDVAPTETTSKLIVSGNVCSGALSDSDSESKFSGKATGAVGASAETIARFWSKVNKNGPVPSHRPDLGPCWLWTGGTIRGYGQFTLPRDLYGKQPHVYAHRFAYELTHGPIPTDTPHVCHHCDLPLCVRADSHLFAGTQANNLDDARAKGRLIDGLGARKLSDDAYRDILSATGRGSGIALAHKYGVSHITISRIRNGRQGSTFHAYGTKSFRKTA